MRIALCLPGLALVACADRTLMQQDVVQDKATSFDIPAFSPPLVDILFVIDDSPAMRAHEANLTANFRRFMTVLETLPRGLPDVHIGVVTSDLGSRGTSDSQPGASIAGCGGDGDAGVLRHASAVTGAFIANRPRIGRQRAGNYKGSLGDAFAELASVGSKGCAFSQPLEAMRRALDHNPANAGFLRPEANLAIVFISAQDDCTFEHSSFLAGASAIDTFRCTSNGIACTDPNHCRARSDAGMPDVDRYTSFLKSLKDDPDDVMVGVLAGPATPVEIGQNATGAPILDPSCSSDTRSATPSVRLTALAQHFVTRTTPICQADLERGLVLSSCVVGGGGGDSLGSPCVDGDLVDVDPASAGIQPECSVADVQHPYSSPIQTVVPACNAAATNLPCWHAITSALCSYGYSSGLEIKIERTEFPPPDTHVMGSCVTR